MSVRRTVDSFEDRYKDQTVRRLVQILSLFYKTLIGVEGVTIIILGDYRLN